MYAKVFRQIYDGTLATNGPWEALVTFQQLLVLANDNGDVDMTAAAIARVTTIPLRIIEIGLAALCAPDAESRTPDAEGRRIVLLSEGRTWGWRIVNYLKYRQIQKESERREYHRNYYHSKRKKPVEVQQSQPNSTITTGSTDTEAEEDTYTKRKKDSPPPVADAPAPAAEKTAKASKEPAVSSATWDAYAAAYRTRYGAEPVRNRVVNSQMKQVVERLGASESPAVAAFFLTHTSALYLNAMHAVPLLLRDAEKLRTEWATGRNGSGGPAMTLKTAEAIAEAEAWSGSAARRRRQAVQPPEPPPPGDYIDMEAPNAARLGHG